MTAIGDLLSGLDENDLAALAARLAPYLPKPDQPNGAEWLDSKQAAAYLGVSIPTLHRKIAAGAIPCHQDCPGGHWHFRRSELDEWRSEAVS